MFEHPLDSHSWLLRCHFPDVHQTLIEFRVILAIILIFFHLSLVATMTEFNQVPAKPEKPADPPDSMPAEFGLGTATFVVIAGMVGAGILTTSGYTIALVGSNQWMLVLWVLGGVMAVCGA